MNKRTIRLSLFLLTCLVLILYVIRSCVLPLGKKLSESSMSDETTLMKKKLAKTEYMELFCEKEQKNIHIDDNFISKSKFSYGCYMYNKRYRILIHKIKTPENNSLEKIVHIENKNSTLTPRVVYAGYESSSMKFSYSSVYDSVVSNIFITQDGILLNAITKGDSIINYDILSNTTSFRYEKDGAVDILYEALQADIWSEKKPKKEINVTLYKRGDSIYLIVIYVGRSDLPKASSILPKILKVFATP
jgi:hypothetical protein